MKITLYKKEHGQPPTSIDLFYHLYFPKEIVRIFVEKVHGEVRKMELRTLSYNFSHGPRSIRKATHKLEQAEEVDSVPASREVITYIFLGHL
jgi:hypothetical protein